MVAAAGILAASSRLVTEPDCFLRLWIHENRRVFQDRLINDADRSWLDGMLGRMLTQHFSTSWDQVLGGRERILFGDYMGGANTEQRAYGEVDDPKKLVTVMEEFLGGYNEEKPKMNLVMFLDAIEHVSRISRILRQPQGNALLLGVGGSGRQSLSRLAAYMAEYTLFQIEITKNYTVQDWRDDLKKLLNSAGLKEEQTVFLFSDTQIVRESFLEDVNNLLNSGEVPSLWSNEDMDNIFASCKVECQRKGIPATKLNAYSQFVARVRRNLHVVLCMSPMGNAFRTRLRMFPALVNCCTIDWFSAWPSEALESVAMSQLTDNGNQAQDKLGFDLPAVVRMFEFIHTSVEQKSLEYREQIRRYNYVTPTSYLELLRLFSSLLREKKEAVGGMIQKLRGGVNKLDAATADVSNLQIELTAKQPVLVKTQESVQAMMIEIAEDTKNAAATKESVEKQEAESLAKETECKEIKEDAQRDLDKALPLLEEAVSCLSKLNKNDLDEVRAMKKPPNGVRLALEAACIMLNKKPTLKADPTQIGKKVADYWETAQKELLANPKVLLSLLQTYDKDNIAEDTIKKISPYMDREDFEVKAIEKASKACTAIAMWVHAMFSYYHVSLEVEPKRMRLREAEANLAVVRAALKEAQEKLAAVTERIRVLTENYDKAVAQQQALQEEVETCQVKLERANKLIGGLGGERVRWTSTIESLQGSFQNIVGDVLIAAGTVAYLGAFTNDFRQKLMEQWRDKLRTLGINHSEGCNIRSTLADPVQVREWNLCGLPTDSVSTENGTCGMNPSSAI
mgnify:CR=1 FL=1